jgi:glutathione S-transferase
MLLELIGGPASNFVWTCRIVLTEKRVPYTLTAVMPHTPEVDAIHPFGKIPVMRYNDVVLAESRAICGYIERMFDGPPLVPTDPIKFAQVEQWVSILNTHIHPTWIQRYVGGGYVFPGTPDKSPNRVAIDEALPKMGQQFPVMNEAVKDNYLVGNNFTLADAYFVPMLFYANKFPEGAALVAKHKGLKAYLARHIERKSIKETMPQSQPGTAGTVPVQPPPAADTGSAGPGEKSTAEG